MNSKQAMKIAYSVNKIVIFVWASVCVHVYITTCPSGLASFAYYPFSQEVRGATG